jgi:hypothetical protein
MSIFARSPYIIEISETGQEGSKIELRLWNGTGSAPTDPQYILSKLIPASNNVNTYYNISPYIREYISWNVRQQIYNTTPDSETTQWCNAQVKRYKLDAGVYTLLSTTTYKAFDGFGYYEQGYNPNLYSVTTVLHDQGTFTYAYDSSINPSSNNAYRGGHATVLTDTLYRARYTNLRTGAVTTVNISSLTPTLKDVYRVHPNNYADGNKFQIGTLSGITFTSLWEATFKPNLNCRYTPVLCDFVNQYGAWQRTWFYAASNNTLSVENTKYNLMQSTFPNYNTLEGQTKSFNTNGKNSIKVNTDWVDESYNNLLKQLMLSERILINSLPATLKTQSTELFKNINQKTINYQLEFDFSYNTINNVI